MNAASSQRVQVGRESRHEGLTFAGAHLGNLALVQHESADHLHVEVAHAGRALARFADQGKRLGQDFVQHFLFAIPAIVFVARVFNGIGDLGFEESRALAQLFVGKLLNLRLEVID